MHTYKLSFFLSIFDCQRVYPFNSKPLQMLMNPSFDRFSSHKLVWHGWFYTHIKKIWVPVPSLEWDATNSIGQRKIASKPMASKPCTAEASSASNHSFSPSHGLVDGSFLKVLSPKAGVSDFHSPFNQLSGSSNCTHQTVPIVSWKGTVKSKIMDIIHSELIDYQY